MNCYGRNKKDKPILAIIGGSGICKLEELKIIKRIYKKNKYGFPSDDILIGEYGGMVIAFLPRHGSKHLIPPHKIPYKANIEALKNIGIKCIIATCIAGSLKKRIKPGSIVIPDQFINFTYGRDDYYSVDKSFLHLPMAEPYCTNLRKKLFKSVVGTSVFSKGTVVVIQGPRFSTYAESRFFMNNNWDIVNMTQYPEGYFAKEAGICYAALAAITDYDVGLHEDLTIKPGEMSKILQIFHEDIKKTKASLLSTISSFENNWNCTCANNAIKTYYQ